VLEVDDYREPSFRRLFTHRTWKRYTAKSTVGRWFRAFLDWRYCLVGGSVWPLSAFVAYWSLIITSTLPLVVPMQSLFQWSSGLSATLSLQGAAIGLLLVFRTDNAFRRLEEARELWGRAIWLIREVMTKCVNALEISVVCDLARLLCAFLFALRDKLRDEKRRDDILNCLLEPEVAEWISSQRSRPLAILGRVRRILHKEERGGALEPTEHYMIDCDVRELFEIVANCERLFSPPIPPNMARHGMRSVMLWLGLLPIQLASSGLPPLAIAVCAATTSYIYLGIDELGVQVEQPFKIMPLWQLCHVAQLNIEEALASPELPLTMKRSRATPFPEAERFDVDDEDGGFDLT